METERLVIRRFTPDDWKDLHEYLSLAYVLKYDAETVSDEEECREKAAARAGGKAFWAVCLKDTGKMIGHIYFNQADPPDFLTWEIGYIFNPLFWGNGYATEACRRILRYGFEELGAHRIKAGCSPDNPPSWRLLERLGMRREAHEKKFGFFRRTAEGEPIWLDSYQYAILDEESVRLSAPSRRYRDQFYEAQAEYRTAGEEPTFGLHFLSSGFDDVLKAVDDWANGVTLPPGEGRRRVLWLVRDCDDKLLGTVNVRSLDTEYFIRFGGNIGYSVRPSERRKGYAARMLSLALEECRRAGMEKALVTCNPENAASIGTIAKNGGVLDGGVTDENGEKYLRFWIGLRRIT
jgi:RimJ/RimL family protein N-acetyltransferase